MNSPSEQIRPDLSLEIAMDQVLTPKQQQNAMMRNIINTKQND